MARAFSSIPVGMCPDHLPRGSVNDIMHNRFWHPDQKMGYDSP